jgi:O-acetyl-ADP-ribose deacetylase (regulator of RNase III)/uncharacterized protein YwgA
MSTPSINGVKVIDGDLFNSGAQTLVNTVNTEGVMGKGVALQFKNRYPEMFKDYVERCRRGEVRLGRPYLYKRLITPWILNFPTKDHWRSLSRLSDITEGLEHLRTHYKEWGVTSLAVPPLGAGNGGLEWRVVGPTLYRELSMLDIPVELYAPHGTPANELTGDFLLATDSDLATVRRMSPAWVALVAILRRIEAQRYRWPIGRVAFQKIAYFATESGLPTGLEFVRGSYGPFSPELKRVVSRLINNGLMREKPSDGMFITTVGPTFKDAAQLFRSKLENWDSIIDHVADLFLRMRTRNAEIAATVHFAATRLVDHPANATELDVFDAVTTWKQKRRPPLNDSEIAATIRSLNLLNWVSLEFSSDLPLPPEMRDPLAT